MMSTMSGMDVALRGGEPFQNEYKPIGVAYHSRCGYGTNSVCKLTIQEWYDLLQRSVKLCSVKLKIYSTVDSATSD